MLKKLCSIKFTLLNLYRISPRCKDLNYIFDFSRSHTLASGEALRGQDLKARHCFNAGDTVRIVAAGPGYSVSSEGLALGPGLEGQSARARTEGGRIVTGVAAGQRRIELTL